MAKYFSTQIDQIYSLEVVLHVLSCFNLKKIITHIANTVSGTENKIYFDFVENQKSLYFTF
jgi:hypothetical protein